MDELFVYLPFAFYLNSSDHFLNAKYLSIEFSFFYITVIYVLYGSFSIYILIYESSYIELSVRVI